MLYENGVLCVFMGNCFKLEDLSKKEFIFVSYSHKDSEIVEADVNYLIDKGVCIWYDSDVLPGDNWKERIRKILTHENCRGVIFYNSINAFLSKSINDERKLTLDIIEEKNKLNPKEVKPFICLSINLTARSILGIIKKLFSSLPEDENELIINFPQDYLDNIIKLFGEAMVFCYGDQTKREKYLDEIYNALKNRVSTVIDEDRFLEIKSLLLGKYKGAEVNFIPEKFLLKDGEFNYKEKTYFMEDFKAYEFLTIEWLYLYNKDGCKYFISKNPIDLLNGGEALNEWLKNKFLTSSFTEEQQKYIKEIRLFKENDLQYIENIDIIKFDIETEMQKHWWIADSGEGILQKTMRANGEVYHHGFKPKARLAGVRPIIVIDNDDFEKIDSKCKITN